MKNVALRTLLLALPIMLRRAASKHQVVKDHMRSGGNCVVQIGLKDGSIC